MRFGIGYDKIPIGDHSQGLEAHSDGDVSLHAIIDALLGASGLGDIGAISLIMMTLSETLIVEYY